jgi:hypothetical protein
MKHGEVLIVAVELEITYCLIKVGCRVREPEFYDPGILV